MTPLLEWVAVIAAAAVVAYVAAGLLIAVALVGLGWVR